MLPYLNAFNAFLYIYSQLPVPFRAFILTFMVLSLAFALFKYLTTRT